MCGGGGELEFPGELADFSMELITLSPALFPGFWLTSEKRLSFGDLIGEKHFILVL